jgi:hypothetical protein
MKVFIGTLGTITLAASLLSAQDKPAAADSASLIQNERALYGAIAKGDKETFQALTLPEGIWTTPSSFIPMGPLADGLGSFELSTWTIDNARVVWTDGNSALVLYVRSGGGSFDHRSFAPTTLASTLWTKRAGKWVAVHHQESDLR